MGGDYFDVFPISEDRTAVLIADVAGKGLGAALLTAVLQGALSGMTLSVDPVRVFNHINQFLCEHSGTGRYATMFFAIIASDGTLEYIPAGHPAPLLLRRGEVTELYDSGSFPVGLVDGAEFTSTRVQLEPEDTLVLFSDGVTEAQDRERKLFGTPTGFAPSWRRATENRSTIHWREACWRVRACVVARNGPIGRCDAADRPLPYACLKPIS